MEVELVRFCYGSSATCGWLRVDDEYFATIERPWVPDETYGSAPSESCVPDGEYQLEPHDSEKFPNTFILFNEDLRVARYKRPLFRYGILIHAGNWARDVEGCIALGRKHTIHDNTPMVTDSRDSMETLRESLGSGSHTLTIRRTQGAPYARTPGP